VAHPRVKPEDCLQDLVKEVQRLTDALLPRRFHRVALVCSPAFAGAGSWLRDSALHAFPIGRALLWPRL